MQTIKILFSFCLIGIFCTSCVSAKPTTEQIEAYKQWFFEKIPDAAKTVRLGDWKEDQLRLGIYAVKDIEREMPLFTIPSEFLLTHDMISLSTVGSALDPVFQRFSNNKDFNPAYYEGFALWLLHEKLYNPNSEWKPWIDILPDVDDMNNILFWSYSELRELIGSPLFQRAKDRRKEVEEHYAWLSEEIFDRYTRIFPEKPSLEDYKWAISVVRDRNVQFHIHGVKQAVMVPFYDQFRHRAQDVDEVYWSYNALEETVEVTTRQSYDEDEEIYVFWGEKCNSELVDFHGYLDEDNSDDCVHVVDLSLSKADPLWQTKTVLFERTVERSGHSNLKMTQSGVTQDLVNALKALTILGDEITADMLMNGVPDEPISDESEVVISASIAEICRRAAQSYPTTVEEDEKLLEKDDLNPRVRMAIQVRKREKEILDHIGRSFYYQSRKLAAALEAGGDEGGDDTQQERKDEL